MLVLCQEPVQPLAPIKARAIGVMTMFDSGASTDKIIAVATNDPEFNLEEALENEQAVRGEVSRFEIGEQLEGKQVQVEDIKPAYAAMNVIDKARTRYKRSVISFAPILPDLENL